MKTVQINDEAPFRTCSSCFEEAERGFQKFKALFEWYLEQGLARAEANLRVILAIQQDSAMTKSPRLPA